MQLYWSPNPYDLHMIKNKKDYPKKETHHKNKQILK